MSEMLDRWSSPPVSCRCHRCAESSHKHSPTVEIALGWTVVITALHLTLDRSLPLCTSVCALKIRSVDTVTPKVLCLKVQLFDHYLASCSYSYAARSLNRDPCPELPELIHFPIIPWSLVSGDGGSETREDRGTDRDGVMLITSTSFRKSWETATSYTNR